MNRRLTPILIALALAMPPSSFAAPGAAPKTDLAQPEVSNEADAQALKVAEMKLAALAKEAKAEDGGAQVDTASAAKKKQAQSTRKKRRAHARLKAQTKGDRVGQKILGRRLTEAEVRGILTTTRDFTGSDLSGMNLVGMDLSGVKFNRANLHLANMERADLAESDLELADLSGANLRGASLNQARLRGTRLDGTQMDGALWIDKTICKKGSVGSCIE